MERPPSSGRFAARLPRAADPRDAIPNDNGPGPNTPPMTVGPTSSTNAPGNFVMSAWSGWPAPTSAGIQQPWGAPPMEPIGEVGKGGGDYSGFGYGRQDMGGYMKRVSTVMTCVDLNTRQLATFPAYGVKGFRRGQLPSWYASPEPELYPDWVAFMKAAGASYYMAGEVVLYCTGRFADGYPSRFIALDPSHVYRDPEGRWYLGSNDSGEEVPDRDICHIPYQTLPGVQYRRGIGPLRWTWRHVVSAAELDAYASGIAKYGVWAILKSQANLDGKQAADLQQAWMTARYNAAGAPAVLGGGLEFETLTLSPQDMALLDLKFFDLEMIAAAFGVPAVLVNLPQNTGLNYTSTTMLADWHWRATLRPHAQAFSASMSRWLLPNGVAIEFDPDRYTQPSLHERALSYSILHGVQDDKTGLRALTVPEIRGFERWAIEGAPLQDAITEGISV